MFDFDKIKDTIKSFSEIDEKATNKQTIILGNMSKEGLFICGHKDDFLMVYTDYDVNGEPKPFFTIASRFGNLYTYREIDDFNEVQMCKCEDYIKDCIFEYFPELKTEKNIYDLEGLSKALQQYKNTEKGGFCNDWEIISSSKIDFLIVRYKDKDMCFIKDKDVHFTDNFDLSVWERGQIVMCMNDNLFSIYQNQLKNLVELTVELEEYGEDR